MADLVRFLGFAPPLALNSSSIALSYAFQARISSCDSALGVTVRALEVRALSTVLAVSRNLAAPPCLSATRKRCSHSLNSRRCAAVRAVSSGVSSCGKSRSMLVLRKTDCQICVQTNEPGSVGAALLLDCWPRTSRRPWFGGVASSVKVSESQNWQNQAPAGTRSRPVQ